MADSLQRAKQNNLLRSAVSAAFNDSAMLSISHDFFDMIYSGYAQRLRRWSTVAVANSQDLVKCPEDEPEPVPQIMPLRPRLVSSHSLDESVGHQHLEIKPRSVSQPNIHRRYSRPTLPGGRAQDRKGSSSTRLETQIEENPALQDESEDESEPEPIAELDGTPSEHVQSPPPSPDLTRNESITTTTTTSANRSELASSQQPRLASSIYDNKHEESFPEPVIIHDRPRFSSHDFEKSYPEVAVGPVTSIQEDNMSLFSESGSMPVTTRSGGRIPSQKKWNGMFKGSKKGNNFATPIVRFFSSGKYMIAWTRYGGVCFDVNNPNESRVQSINAGDIVLGAGGSRRYAIVARYNEVSDNRAARA